MNLKLASDPTRPRRKIWGNDNLRASVCAIDRTQGSLPWTAVKKQNRVFGTLSQIPGHWTVCFWLWNLKQGQTNTSLYFISSSSGLWWSLLIIYWIRKQKWHFHWKMRNCHFQHAITTSPWCNDHLIGRLTDARPPPPSLSHLGQSLKNNKKKLRLPSTPCLD